MIKRHLQNIRKEDVSEIGAIEIEFRFSLYGLEIEETQTWLKSELNNELKEVGVVVTQLDICQYKVEDNYMQCFIIYLNILN